MAFHAMHQLTYEPQITSGFDLFQHIEKRKTQIKRVLEFHKLDAEEAFLTIERTEFRCVDDIRVRYLAHVFDWNEPVPSDEEQLQAHFDGKGVFYFIGVEPFAWRELGKVLALLVSPEGEPGLLAASIKEVLAASSSIEAERSLDDLGFPPAAVRISEATSEPPVETIGNAGAESGSLGEPEAPVLGATGGTAPSSIGVNTIPLPGDARGTAGQGAGASKSRSGQPQSRLPVYVGTGKAQTETVDTEARDRILEIDRKGVERVMQAERDAGRQPRLMPHNHPGFDIEVSNEEGAVERVIEVKSTAGAWRERGVAMSSSSTMPRMPASLIGFMSLRRLSTLITRSIKSRILQSKPTSSFSMADGACSRGTKS